MTSLRDYPDVKRHRGSWNIYARERGAAIKLASSHLRDFARFKETGWRPNASVLAAAVIYCRINMLPSRFAVEQILCQLYEQKALSEVHPYPPHLSPQRKRFFLPFLKRTPSAPQGVTLR